MKITGNKARTFLRLNSFLLVDTANGEPVRGPLTFEDIMREIWEGICNSEDLCFSELNELNLENDESIFGYDLSEAMCRKRV
jgi:hypothetical protein